MQLAAWRMNDTGVLVNGNIICTWSGHRYATAEGATREDRRWVMRMLDVPLTATEKGFSVSLGVPLQVAATVPGTGASKASILYCRP